MGRLIPKINPVIHLAWMALVLSVSCSSGDRRPEAQRVPVAEIEKTFGRLISVANAPTPDQHGTATCSACFADDGTIWGIPLSTDDSGNLLACAAGPAYLPAAPADKSSGSLARRTAKRLARGPGKLAWCFAMPGRFARNRSAWN
jgi:hypothetical protein